MLIANSSRLCVGMHLILFVCPTCHNNFLWSILTVMTVVIESQEINLMLVLLETLVNPLVNTVCASELLVHIKQQ